MALAVLCSTGWGMPEAMRHMSACRPCVNFPGVYVDSVCRFLNAQKHLVVISAGGGSLVGVPLGKGERP
jgi:hypothetical protein